MNPADAAMNRQTEMRLGAKGRRVFTAAGWNKALRDAGIAAGNWWIANYGPLRWNESYARGQLGYKPGKAKSKRMRMGEPPFFSSGAFQAGYNSRARTEATAKKGGARFWIVIPGGWLNAHERHVKAFRTIPAREAAAVAREYRRAVIVALQQGRAAAAAKKQAKVSAKAAKKAANAARRAQTRANRNRRTSTRRSP